MRRQPALLLEIDRLGEEEVRDVLGVHVQHERVASAHLVEGSREPFGIARELRAPRVGEEFALARHHRLDQAPEEEADVADEKKEDGEDRDRDHHAKVHLDPHLRLRIEVARVEAQPQEKLSDLADDHDAREDADHAHVERHVAVHDVAELMAATQPRVTTTTGSEPSPPAANALMPRWASST